MGTTRYLKVLFTAATLALGCMPLLGMRPVVPVIVLWSLAALLYTLFAKHGRGPDLRTFLLLASPFLVMVLDLVRADDPLAGWHIVERSGMLIIAPFVVFVLRPPVDDGLRDRVTDVFALSGVVLAAYANLRIAGMDIAGASPFEHRYRAAFTAVTDLHPPFAAYFLLAGALFMLHRVLRDERSRLLRACVGATLFVAGAMLGSRTPLIAFLLAALVLMMMHLPTRPALRGVAAAVALVILTALVLPTARERLLEVVRTPLDVPTTEVNSVNERFVIATCTKELLVSSWVFGIGQSSVQPALDACYTQFNDPRYLDRSYSTHCQPLHWWLSFGIVGLVLFVALFGLPFRAALQVKDARLAAYLVFFAVCCLTENVLARQWGVVPFAFFVSLLSPPLFAGARSARARSHR